jgi:sulfoxide reductase heme-binding subunit YedZ
LVWQAFTGGLGANPIEAINRFLGDWALRFLLLTLALTPLKEITGLTVFVRVRRMIGLFAFFYVFLHIANYVGLDQFFAWGEIWKDILKRQYITIGMVAFVLLVPLAVTSTSGMIKRLGAVRWKRLHQLVYPAAILGVLHFFLMVKADIREPMIYAAILAVLLGYRVATGIRRRQRSSGSSSRRVRQAESVVAEGSTIPAGQGR